jgi:hypothetical protein
MDPKVERQFLLSPIGKKVSHEEYEAALDEAISSENEEVMKALEGSFEPTSKSL